MAVKALRSVISLLHLFSLCLIWLAASTAEPDANNTMITSPLALEAVRPPFIPSTFTVTLNQRSQSRLDTLHILKTTTDAIYDLGTEFYEAPARGEIFQASRANLQIVATPEPHQGATGKEVIWGLILCGWRLVYGDDMSKDTECSLAYVDSEGAEPRVVAKLTYSRRWADGTGTGEGSGVMAVARRGATALAKRKDGDGEDDGSGSDAIEEGNVDVAAQPRVSVRLTGRYEQLNWQQVWSASWNFLADRARQSRGKLRSDYTFESEYEALRIQYGPIPGVASLTRAAALKALKLLPYELDKRNAHCQCDFEIDVNGKVAGWGRLRRI